MKTAKEICQELEKIKQERKDYQINQVIDLVLNNGGEVFVHGNILDEYSSLHKEYYVYHILLKEEVRNKLKELGFKVEECEKEKSIYTKLKPADYETVVKKSFWPWEKTHRYYRRISDEQFGYVPTMVKGFMISACCGEK